MKTLVTINRILFILTFILYFLASLPAYKYLLTGIIHPTGYYNYDFGAYYNAAAVLNSDKPILYDQQVSDEVAKAVRMETKYSPYIYPPFFAVIFKPMALLDHRLAIWMWMIFNLMLLILCTRTLANLYPTKAGDQLSKYRISAIILGAFLIFPPVYHTLILGQVNILLFWLLLLVYRNSISPKSTIQEIIAGAALGFVTGIKLFTIVLFPYLWFYRKGKITLFGLGTFLLTILIGIVGTSWSTNYNYLPSVRPGVSQGLFSIDNNALIPTIKRMYIPISFPLQNSFLDKEYIVEFTNLPSDPEIAIAIGWVSMLSIVLITLLTLWTSWRSFVKIDHSLGYSNGFMLLVIVSLLLMPSGWTSTSMLTLLLLPITILFCEQNRDDIHRELQKSLLILALGLMLINCSWLDIGWLAKTILPFWILTLAAISMIIIWGIYLWRSWRELAFQDNKLGK